MLARISARTAILYFFIGIHPAVIDSSLVSQGSTYQVFSLFVGV
jgi:hypothetical protein